MGIEKRDEEDTRLGKKTMPGISQCMIVKNEEKNIERALLWGKGIVSEQIVVDTGSTDGTIEIAKEMGASVYPFTWSNDFSAAKNYAVSKAGYEWIAFLDADEYFSPEDAKKLPSCIKRLEKTAYDAVTTTFINLDHTGKVLDVRSHLRIFRNLPKLRYHRRIHESLKKSDGTELRIADMTGELSIYHTGYGEEEIRKKQGLRRNLDLILVELAEHPDDYEMYGYLGNEYEGMGEFGQAEKSYRKAVSLMPEALKGNYGVTSSEIWRRFLNVLTLMPEKPEAELLEVYREAKKSWPEDGDYDYIMGQYYGSHGSYRTAERHLKTALNLLERYGYGDKSSRLSGNILKAYEMLAMCCFNNGNLEECVKITAFMLKENPYLMSVLVVMLSALLKDPGTGGRGQEGAVETAEFLGKNFYQFQTMKDRLFVLQAAMSCGYQGLVEVIKNTFTPEEFAAVDRSFEGKLSENFTREIPRQFVAVPAAVNIPRQDGKLRIALFYCPTESFNFFSDQLNQEFRAKRHETFILDLRNPECRS